LITIRHTESEVADMSSWEQANRGEKLGLVWRNRKKISQIIYDYLYLPFFLLIILWSRRTTGSASMALTGTTNGGATSEIALMRSR
jgi:hypothetical protein